MLEAGFTQPRTEKYSLKSTLLVTCHLLQSYSPLHQNMALYGKKDSGEGGDHPYAFGLGKRAAYNFGLGKRAAYTFGLGRKRDPYAFGLGKRGGGGGDRAAYAFGLGKRDPV